MPRQPRSIQTMLKACFGMDGFKPKRDRSPRQRPPIGELSARLRRRGRLGPLLGTSRCWRHSPQPRRSFRSHRRVPGSKRDGRPPCQCRHADWQRDLPVAYIKVGDVLLAHGNLAEALTSYRKGLAIIERLAEDDPDNTGWQRDFVASYGRVGSVLAQQGETILARDTFYRGRSIVAQLKDQFADDAQLPKRLTAFDAEIAKLEQAQTAERRNCATGASSPVTQADVSLRCVGLQRTLTVPALRQARSGKQHQIANQQECEPPVGNGEFPVGKIAKDYGDDDYRDRNKEGHLFGWCEPITLRCSSLKAHCGRLF